MPDYRKVRDFSAEVGILDAKLQGLFADYSNEVISYQDYQRELANLIPAKASDRNEVQQWVVDKNADAKNRELDRIATKEDVIPHLDSATQDQAYHNANIIFGTRNQPSLWGQLKGQVNITHPDLPMHLAGRTTETPWHEGIHRLQAEKGTLGKLTDLEGNAVHPEVVTRAIDYLRGSLIDDGKLTKRSRKWLEDRGYVKPFWGKDGDMRNYEDIKALAINFIDQMYKDKSVGEEYLDNDVIREAVDRLDDDATAWYESLVGDKTIETKTSAPMDFNKSSEQKLKTLLEVLPLSYNLEREQDSTGIHGQKTDYVTIDLDRTGFEPSIK